MASKNYLLLSASIIVTIIVGVGGVLKFVGIPDAHTSFQLLGLPSWFGYFIGACEVLGSIAILIRPLSTLAAFGISVIMLGAIYFHIAHTPIVQVIPATIAFFLSIYVGLKKRGDIFAFGKS